MDWEFGISRCKVLYTGWINSKVHRELYLMSLINHDGKEYEKEYTYIHTCVCVCVYIYIYIYIYKL